MIRECSLCVPARSLAAPVRLALENYALMRHQLPELPPRVLVLVQERSRYSVRGDTFVLLRMLLVSCEEPAQKCCGYQSNVGDAR